jgi:hypothetical protein
MRSLGFYILVYNAGLAIEGDKYINIERDVTGTWWADGVATLGEGCAPDVQAVTSVTAQSLGCGEALITAQRKRFNCDGTTDDLTPGTARISIGSGGSVEVVTDISVSGECNGDEITINVTLTKQLINTGCT